MTVDAERGRSELIRCFHEARADPGRVVIEGFHALKHALRFGARIETAVAVDPAAARALAHSLAPDIERRLADILEPVPAKLFRELAPHPPDSGILALARRPSPRVPPVPLSAPVVLLDAPAHLGNLGAAVRVAAAAGAAAVLTTGPLDPWHPTAVRAAAGLHFALPVARIADLDAIPGPIIGLDPNGAPIHPRKLPRAAIYAFGSERRGLSAELRDRTEALLALPMREGVSSLNLATSVAALLYLLALCR